MSLSSAVNDLAARIATEIKTLATAVTGKLSGAAGAVGTSNLASNAVTAVKIGNGEVTNAKLANVNAGTLKGRNGTTTGAPADLVASEVLAILGIEAGAQVNPTASEILSALLTVDGISSGLNADLVRNETPTSVGLDLLSAINGQAAQNTIGGPFMLTPYAGFQSENSIFPIGTTIGVSGISPGMTPVVRNQAALIYVGSSGAGGFNFSQTGALLTGTWRARGVTGFNGTTPHQLFQRTL